MSAGEDQGDRSVGQLIAGRFHVLRKLNQGGMDPVYLARQRPMDRPVALKLLPGRHAADPLAARRFHDAAQAASRVRNSHVITLYEFGSTDSGELYIAMEYLQGASLREVTTSQPGFLSWQKALSVAGGVAAALAAAHAAGVIHGDLKPENVMLIERDGTVDFPVVLDFGLAASLEPRMPTGPRDVMARNLAYLSPERAHGIDNDPRSDLYALGAMWFEMLTGHAPFAGASGIEVILRHSNEAPAVPSQANPHNAIPPAVDDIVLSLLEKHPERRPRSAAELLQRIDSFDSVLRPQGWHIASSRSIARHGIADPELRSFAVAASALDHLDFSLADLPISSQVTVPRSSGTPPADPDAVDPEPVLLTKRKQTDLAAPMELHLLSKPKRPSSSRRPTLRIADIAEVSSLIGAAATARDVAEGCVAFLGTRFERALVADVRTGQVLASTGAIECPAFLAATSWSGAMRDMLRRPDAFYGVVPQTAEWQTFFAAAEGDGVGFPSAPGAFFLATLKREGAPALLFYGDHADANLRADADDVVALLRAAAHAFNRVGD